MKVNILGTEYSIEKKSYQEDKHFEYCDGYCDRFEHRICYCDLTTSPEWEAEPFDKVLAREKIVIRHEIVHAFLFESGLAQDSHASHTGWAVDEEMVDWFALQGPKIYKAWQEAEAVV